MYASNKKWEPSTTSINNYCLSLRLCINATNTIKEKTAYNDISNITEMQSNVVF